jgi:aminopeptidase YwaD
MQFSSPGKVEAELVAAGTGTESEFSKLSVRGNIVLVRRGGILFSDAARNAERAGAVATIVYNNAPERFVGALRDKTANPVLAISGRDGQTLLDLLSKGAVKIKIESDTAIRQVMARNIIATKRGATESVVIMGAHYDSVDVGAGANDNGSGASVLLELARAMSQKSYKATLVFVAFDAEELGLIGSRHYVTSLADDARKKIVAMLNFDMLGGGSGPLLFDGDGRVGKLALDVAKELGIDAHTFSLGSGASGDHSSFRSVGIDEVFFMREYNLLHTPQDTIEQVRAEWLGEAGRVAMKVVEKLE